MDKKADVTVPTDNNVAGAAIGKKTSTCLLCPTVLQSENELRKHFTLNHLPWYFRVAAADAEDSDVEIKLRPVLKSYVKGGRLPFEYFAKLWGCLTHGFLRQLIALINLPATEDLLRHVTKHSPVDPTQYTPFVEEVILMRSHELFYTGKMSKVLTLCPPSCLSALLHWRTLMSLVSGLSDQLRQDLYSYHYPSDLTDLISGNLAQLTKKSSKRQIPINSSRKHQLCKAIVQEDLTTIWKHISENKDIVNVTIKRKTSRNPLQFAVASGHLKAAQLLLFNGALVGRRDREGLTPLCRAAKKANVNGVNTLLPWESKDELLNAIELAELHDRRAIVRIIKDHINLVEKVASGTYRK